MSTIELKEILIHKISAINDKTFLQAIKTILDSKTDNLVYNTSSKQKGAINEGLVQIENGEFLPNDQVEEEISKWLKENQSSL